VTQAVWAMRVSHGACPAIGRPSLGAFIVNDFPVVKGFLRYNVANFA
jgi:hypothetical protein